MLATVPRGNQDGNRQVGAMKRTTISLPDDVTRRLRREAQRRGVSVSELARQALQAYLNNGEARNLRFATLGAGGHTDTAENMKAMLAQEWGGASERCGGSS